jgi:NAD-dependent dihydropyrimidine dehydrogenase PreA subunit
MKEGKATIAYPYDCIACLACENDCPTDAINVALVD